LVEPYELSSLHFYHFDFYRLKNQEEWEQAGFREYFSGEALCAVEWPERAHGLLAPPDLDIELRFEGERRRARLSAHSEAGEAWLSSLRSLS
jgi:tRNA threonylcarbamoyladenosine biosynthesis protein TsaE